MTYRYRTAAAFMEAFVPLAVGIAFIGTGFASLWRGRLENLVFALVGVPVYAIGAYYTRRFLNERIEIDGETIRWYDPRGVNRITAPLAGTKKPVVDRHFPSPILRIDTPAGPILYAMTISNANDLDNLRSEPR